MTDPSRPRAGLRRTASLSHFVRSLLGLLPRCPAGQGEVGARWRFRKGWRAGGEEDEGRVQAAPDGGASVRRCGPGSGKGESRRRMPGGWGEGGREGLICPPSCSNKRRPPARTAHAGRGRSEGAPARRRAHARAPRRLHRAGLSRAVGGARPWPLRPRGKSWQRGGTRRVRREAQPLPRQALEEPHTVPVKLL